MHTSSRISLPAVCRLAIIVAGSLLLLALPADSRMALGADPFADFDAYSADALKDWNTPAMAVSVVRNGRVVFARGYGVRKLGGNDPVDADTVFPIASITKSFNATAIAMLVEDGKLDWTDPVIKHLPDFQLRDPYMTRELQIADLLSHRTGLEDPDTLCCSGVLNRAELLRRARFLPQIAPFRTEYRYNNLGPIITGEILERVTGRSWADFVRDRILHPLAKVAYATGLRRGELASLTTESLLLDDTTPTIVVEAWNSKRGHRDLQPIPTWLANELRTWLRSKPILLRGPRQLWPGSWEGRGAEMLRVDLEAAKIPYRDEAGHVFDFHSLRHQYATGMAKRGVHPKKAQQLSRHSDINLTMNTYTHLAAVDLVETVEAIPDPSAVVAQQQQRATGTDDRVVPQAASRCCAPVAHPESEKSGDKTRSNEAQQQSAQEVNDNLESNYGAACCAPREEDDFESPSATPETKKALILQGPCRAEGRGL